MKRFLSTLLAVVMVLALAAPAIAESRTMDASALRDAPAFTLTADKDQVQQGEEVTLTLNLAGSYTATTINTKLYYDADKFEYVSHAGGTVYTTAQATGNAMCIIQHMANDHFLTCGIAMYSGDFNYEGTVYTLTLKAKTDAALGNATFTPEMVDFSYLGANPPATPIDHTITGCTVEIVEAVVPEGVVITMVPSKTNVQPGETFTVAMNISGDYAAAELTFRFPFDRTLFTAGTATNGAVMEAVEDDGGEASISTGTRYYTVSLAMGDNPISAVGTVCTIEFTVKDGVEGSYSFEPSNIDFYDANDNDIEYTIVPGTVTIAAEARPVVFTATASKTEVQPGETFTVDFSISGTYEAHAITWQLSTDEDLFETVSLTEGEVITAARAAGGTAMAEASNLKTVIIMPTDPLTAEGVIFTVTFRVKDGASGSYTFTPDIIRFSNYPADGTETPIDYTTETATVTIAAAEPVVFTATASKAQVEQGETFTVELSVSGTYAANTMDVQLSIDTDRFEVVSLTRGEVITAATAAGATAQVNNDTLRVMIIMPEGAVSAEGVIFTATIKAKEDATGTYTFNPVINRFSNYPVGGTETFIEYTVVGAPVEIIEVVPATYTITWVVEGQDNVTTTVEAGETPEYPYGTPVKSGDAQYTYTFAGWTPDVVPATADATYTATWTQTVNTYTITWDVDGETTTETYEYGATPVYPNGTPTKAADAQYTYTFAGWDPEITSVTGEQTYVATWTQTVNTYTITWVIDDATETETYEYGATPAHADPVKEGYTFNGWTPAITAVTGDATYTAQFTVNKYRLSIYYLNQATGYAMPGATAVFADIEYGAEYSYTSPAITGYHLVDEAQAVISGTMPAQAVEVDVYYAINTYTITWVVDGQDNVTTTVNHGETPVYPNGTPTKEADAQYTYEFAGWTPNVTAATEDATYTATWNTTVNTYTITWNIDGATETETYAYGQTPAHNDPTKPADAQYTYTFAGWDPEIVPVTGDATYTATWNTTVNNYTLTVNYYRYSDALEDWVAVQSPSVTTLPYGSEYTANIPNEIDGYVLDHVDGAQTGTITGNVVVDAYYVVPAPTEYTITWVVDGQDNVTTTVQAGETPVYPNGTPAKEPGDHVMYTFAGWTPDIVPAAADATYTATWTETPFGSVTFLVNGIQIAKLENVTEMTEDMMPEGIAWYGFVFKSWDKTVEDINAEIAQGKDVVVNGVMEVAANNIHLITIYGDDITEKDYTESRWITVTASAQNEAGQYFRYWTIDGVIISYSPKATIRIVASCTLEAHYGDTQLEAVGVAQLLRADYDNLNKREIFVAYMSAPDGATITSAGLYAAPGTEYDPAAGELTAANAKFIKNVNITDASKPCSYTWYKSAVEEGDVWYIRVFVTYELDGETTTILGTTTAITAGTNYVAGN